MNLSEDDQKAEQRKYRKSLLESIEFYKRIDSFFEFVDRISLMAVSRLSFLSYAKKRPCYTIGMSATLSTLEGIKELCEIGDVVDGFVLLRKARDNLFLDLFLMNEARNNYPSETEFGFSFSELNENQILDELMRYMEATIEAEGQNENLQAINQWLDGEYASKENKKMRLKYFGYSQYLKSIENKCLELKECHERFLVPLFDGLENQLNNYVHSNSPEFLSNSRAVYDRENFVNSVKSLLTCASDLKRIFIIILYFIDSTLFAADDYFDALEVGMKPVEGSQYYAIYQIVDEFEDIRKDNPELYEFLKNNNRYGMECFLK